MAIEHERRFLVLNLDNSILTGAKKTEIEQGYFDLIDPTASFRVRIEDYENASAAFKYGTGRSRKEEEEKINDLAFARFLYGECSHFLEKTRYFPDHQVKDGLWTVDVYKHPLEGIIVAEFEYSGRGKEIIIPAWMREYVEVTDSISNLHLARLATELRETAEANSLSSLYEAIIPKRIRRIVLTGGPCSGKSKIMEEIRKRMGGSIQCVPEVASILISQVGIRPEINARRFNSSIYRVQKIFEATSLGQAADEGKKAVIFDRGTVDNAAYMKNGLDDFARLYSTDTESEYRQYDAVICLEVPPREVYKECKLNNAARTEDFETAFQLGERIKKVWGSHPNFHIVPNFSTWDEKKNAALKLIERFAN
jgi:CYTH domain-containing protein/predicted ATPase